MHTLRKVITAAAVGLLTATGALATIPVDTGAGRYSVGIVGEVPVICRANVQAASAPARAGTVSLGQLAEFCNSAAGYDVWVDYSPGLARASLIVGGRRVPLSDGGSTRIRQSNRAAIDVTDLALDLPQGVDAGQIAFRIVPR